LRGCLTVFFALAGAFCVGASLSADPCDREDDAGVVFLLAGLLFIGAAAYGVARAVTERAWIAWASAVMVPVVLGFALYVVLLLRWVEQCTA
jgi:hypothetical protein